MIMAHHFPRLYLFVLAIAWRDNEVLDAVECLTIFEPEVILRPLQTVVLRAIDVPTPEHVTGHGRPHIDVQYPVFHGVVAGYGFRMPEARMRHDF